MKVAFSVLSIALVLFACPAIAGEPTQAHAIAAKNFAFDGIALSTSLKDVLRKYPKADLQRDKSEPNIGLKHYRVVSPKAADVLDMTFSRRLAV